MKKSILFLSKTFFKGKIKDSSKVNTTAVFKVNIKTPISFDPSKENIKASF